MPRISGKGSASKRLAGLAGREKVQLVGRALFAGGEKIKAQAQKNITTGSVSGKNHKPSAPGSAPNNDSGFLKSNIKVYQTGPLQVQVVSEAPYSAIHEFGGTINHPGGTPYFLGSDGKARFVSKSGQGAFHSLPTTKPHQIEMPERPFMGPAARSQSKEVKRLVNKAIDKVTK